jgi:2-polyprenyl-6-methoxyphenol hydroxylase-like FAD-dependent oxidoreductase
VAAGRARIAIVGAGTAGLAAAAFLSGHDVRVFERFAAPAPVGSGLLIQPTGLACLAALGLDGSAIELGHVVKRIHGVTVSGRTIFDVAYRDLGPACFGLAMHRAALFDVLWRAVAARHVLVTAGHDIAGTSLEPEGRSLIDAAGGRHGPFDLVIDASGLRSRLRQAEATVRLDRPYPYGAVWAALEMPPAWPGRHALLQRYEAAHTMCGILPIGRRPDDQRERVAFFWSLRIADMARWRETPIATWKARVARLWPDVQPFLDQIQGHDDLTAARYADVRLARPFTERLIFIGDAARAASPQLGQGANLALIDACVLARILASHPIERAGEVYAGERRAHTRFYGIASRALTPFFQSDSRLAAAVRDLTFAPMARVPYLRREMVRTLAGMKTGLISAFDPGMLHARYTLKAPSGADLARTAA